MRSVAVLALVAGLSRPALASASADQFGTAPDSLVMLAGLIAALASVAAVLWFLQVPVLGLFHRFGNWFSIALAVTLCAGLCGPAWAAFDGTEPDPVLTPGAIRTTDRAAIVGVNTSEVRNVSGAEKLAVYHRYGMKGPNDAIPGTDHLPPHEVDHRCPLCAGGSNDITNLWIQAGDGPWNFHDKDKLEAWVCRRIKRGLITVENAQAMFLGDWKAGYVKAFGGPPNHETAE